MSEKPQHPSSPAEDPADVSRETSGPEKPTPPVEKNKPSSVYIYLVVLFGAAFLMLLLAYFVQQRNNAAELDNLRSTTTASREELLEEIQRLEEENEALQKEQQTLESQLLDLQERYDDVAGLGSLLDKEVQCWYAFWGLESSFQEENYEDCAEFFHLAYGSNYPHIPDTESAQRRARLIYETLLELGYLTEDDPAVFVP